jgi:hypothetical protein
VPPIEDHPVTELVPEVKEGLSEAAPRVCPIQAGPEERQERIALLVPISRFQGEEGKQREALGLEVERFTRGTVAE